VIAAETAGTVAAEPSGVITTEASGVETAKAPAVKTAEASSLRLAIDCEPQECNDPETKDELYHGFSFPFF
jgi:hypothetical protein